MRIVARFRSGFLVFSVMLASGAGQAVAQSAADNPAMYRGPDRE